MASRAGGMQAGDKPDGPVSPVEANGAPADADQSDAAATPNENARPRPAAAAPAEGAGNPVPESPTAADPAATARDKPADGPPADAPAGAAGAAPDNLGAAPPGDASAGPGPDHPAAAPPADASAGPAPDHPAAAPPADAAGPALDNPAPAPAADATAGPLAASSPAPAGAAKPSDVAPTGPPSIAGGLPVTPAGGPGGLQSHEAGAAATVAPADPASRGRKSGRAASPDRAIADTPTGAVWMPGPAPPAKVRYRLLPRTVLGVAAMVLAAAMGAAFSGVVLYSYYDYRLSQNTDKINAFIGSYKKEFDNAKGDLNAQKAAAQAEINKELGPLRQLQASSDTLQALVKKVSPSMFFVHTLDVNGQASVGSAFVIASDANQSLLLTSYTTVQAATHKPGPDLTITQGGVDTKVTVWTWDERYDLALIVLTKGNLPPLTPAAPSPTPALGDRVFAVTGLGSLGGSAVQGVVTDVSAAGLQHTSAIGQAYQGGPLLNASGQVVAVSSRSYQPLNFASDSVWFAPYLRSACDKVLNCPNGTISSQPGGQRTG